MEQKTWTRHHFKDFIYIKKVRKHSFNKTIFCPNKKKDNPQLKPAMPSLFKLIDDSACTYLKSQMPLTKCKCLYFKKDLQQS